MSLSVHFVFQFVAVLGQALEYRKKDPTNLHPNIAYLEPELSISLHCV